MEGQPQAQPQEKGGLSLPLAQLRSGIPELFRRRKVRKAVEASLAGASDRQAIKKEG